MWRRLSLLVVPAMLLTLLQQALQTAERVIINEIAWSGTPAGSNDEWIELYNAAAVSVTLDGWQLSAADGTPSIALSGVIGARGYFLLERTDDSSVADIPADQIYSGALNNSGEQLRLFDAGGLLVDTVDAGDGWPAGSNDSFKRSLERAAGTDAWRSNDGVTRNGHDAAGNPLNATPRRPNSAAAALLSTTLTAPPIVAADAPLTYTIALHNSGAAPIADLQLTLTLPDAIVYSGADPPAERHVWQIPSLAAADSLNLTIYARSRDVNRAATTVLHISAAQPPLSDTLSADTLVGSTLLIRRVHFDAYEGGDEAVELLNVGDRPLDVGGWTLSDRSGSSLALPAVSLAPRQAIWLADENAPFARQFGFAADFSAAELDGVWPGFANSGDSVLVRSGGGHVVDAVVYENGDAATLGWSGPALRRYRSGALGVKGQLLSRAVDEQSGLPVADSDTARDWAQYVGDPLLTRRPQFPGWDSERFFTPAVSRETATLTVAIAPDSSFQAVSTTIASAAESLQISAYKFTNWRLAEQLFAAAGRGVDVDLLLEGSPAAAADADLFQQRLICRRLEDAGGDCWFMINETDSSIPLDGRVYDRYRFLHAKYLIVDGRKVLVGSENFSPNSMPYDDFGDGTSGRRGVLLITDAATVVAAVSAVWQADFDRANHVDILPWSPNHPLYGNRYGLPPADFTPLDESGGYTYTVKFASPVRFDGDFAFAVVQAPENSLRGSDSLLGLIAQAQRGDRLLIQQLDERLHWGDGDSNRFDDPNPRLEAYLAAARRGADVWLLLDSHFDLQGHNRQTCLAVNAIARAERLFLRCQLGNPTDRGIHNKMVLARIGGRGFIHVGSINGSEQSNKGNRELALQIQSDMAYSLLARLFFSDWIFRQHLPLLPVVVEGPADHLLISEIYYNPPGATDEMEYVEIANPTRTAVPLDGWSIGDAVSTLDFEDVRIFPAGAMLAPREAIVVASNARLFYDRFLLLPDYEIYDSHPDVPQLIDDPRYDAAGAFRLGNSGDELLLRDAEHRPVDVVVYGDGRYPGVPAAPLLSSSDRVLERLPWDKDSDNPVNDFREASPSPGRLPQ